MLRKVYAHQTSDGVLHRTIEEASKHEFRSHLVAMFGDQFPTIDLMVERMAEIKQAINDACAEAPIMQTERA